MQHTQTMNGQNEKLRALSLAGLMVLSVFAVAITFSGTAAAIDTDRGDTGDSNDWSTANGEGNVGDGAELFQGEDTDDIQFVNPTNSTVIQGHQLTNEDGENLADIGDDQPTTSYSGVGIQVFVSSPEIQDVEIRSGGPDGADVAGGTIPTGTDVTVWSEYNFGEAENLDITVEDSDETDWTDEVIGDDTHSSLESGASDEVEFDLDMSALDVDEEYTVTLEGTDDLDSDDARRNETFEISSDDTPTLSMEDEEVTKGQGASYEISGGNEGDYHVVTISNGSQITGDAGSVFRNVNDVDEVGNTDGYAYAIVEIDGGVGEGLINTQHLDSTDVTVELRETTDPDDHPLSSIDEDVLDDVDLTVEEGSVTLENPTNSYVPGAEVTVNGTASEGIDTVSMYARDQGEYQRVEINGDEAMDVSAGEFEEEDVQLSDTDGGPGNDILSYPGSYRIALVAGDIGDEPTTSAVAQAVADQHTLRVAEGEFRVNTSVVNGQVAVGDNIEVSGYAPGGDVINVSFIGPRGTFDQYANINVDSDGYFEDEDVVIGDNIRDRFRANIADSTGNTGVAQASIPDDFSRISKGNVVMSIGHKGRDGVMGDGVEPNVTADIELFVPGASSPFTTQPRTGLVGLIYEINTGQYTQGQVAERLVAETGGDVGSDDPSSVVQFRLTDPRTTVDNVVGDAGVNGTVEIGNDMTVSGSTNRQPGDTSITVEVIEGPSRTDFEFESTDQWDLGGQWNATLDTEGIQPGTYTVEASDGTSSDVHQFQLSETVDDGETPTTTTDTPATETDTPTATDTPGNATETTTDGQEGPGFTVAAAVVGLLAVALLAVRRNS